MAIAMVTTQTFSDNEWYHNVLEGISKGVREFNYWTNDWLPSDKEEATRLEVYYEGYLVLAGDIIEEPYKEDYNSVFTAYSNNLYSIGLTPGATASDFDNMLNKYFTSRGKKIGNIIFRVDTFGLINKDITNITGVEGINYIILPNGKDITVTKDVKLISPIQRVIYR